VKCCFASDLHGHRSHYEELLALAAGDKAGAVILGGDLLPRKGHHLASLEGQLAFVRTEFRDFSEKLRSSGTTGLFIILGNDDWAGTIPLFRDLESGGLLSILDGRERNLDGRTALSGYSYVPPTPFLLKDFEKRDMKADPAPGGLRRVYVTRNGGVEETDEREFFENRGSIEEDLDFPADPGCSEVRVMHGPPFGTALDRLYDGRSAGSRAVRNFILKTQPVLTLHGHIHESPEVSGAFAERLGKTISVNAGQTGAGLSAVLFDSDRPGETLSHTLYGPYGAAAEQS
jgi:uncharacterized protein